MILVRGQVRLNCESNLMAHDPALEQRASRSTSFSSLACVASVSNRVIARNLEREQQKTV